MDRPTGGIPAAHLRSKPGESRPQGSRYRNADDGRDRTRARRGVQRGAWRPAMPVFKAEETFPLAGFEAQAWRRQLCGQVGSRLEWNPRHAAPDFLSGPTSGTSGTLDTSCESYLQMLITRDNLQKRSNLQDWKGLSPDRVTRLRADSHRVLTRG